MRLELRQILRILHGGVDLFASLRPKKRHELIKALMAAKFPEVRSKSAGVYNCTAFSTTRAKCYYG